MSRVEQNKMHNIIRENFDTRCEDMVLAYILEKGIEICKQITEEDMDREIKGNGLMTANFQKALVRTAIKVAKECSYDDIINFVLNRCDSTKYRDITYDRMSELATLAIHGMVEDDDYEAKIYMKESMYMEPEEAEYFGIELYDEEDDEDEE